jgi:Uma2 family endonuclease
VEVLRYDEVGMSTKTLMTVDEFAQMQTAETENYELVDGELIPLPSATPRHAKIRDLVSRLTWNYFERNPIGGSFGEIDCRLGEHTVRQPDVSIFLSERLKQMDLDKIPVPFAPDIAVEVLSPSEKAMAVRRKVRDYLRAGSKEVWLLDHANGELLVHTRGGIRVLQGTDVLESPLLPGFSAAVADLVVKV